MPIAVTCSQCGKQHRVAEAHAGKSARCVCGAKIRIPEPEVALLDELSDADLTRAQPVLAAAAAEGSSGPAPQWSPLTAATSASLLNSPASDYLERARDKLNDQQEREAMFAQAPNAVKLAVGGLAALGAFSLVAALLLAMMIALEATFLVGGPLIAVIGIVFHLVLGAVGGTAAALVQFRVRGARVIGIVAAVAGLIGCSPVHLAATVIALLGLFSSDTVEWLSEG